VRVGQPAASDLNDFFAELFGTVVKNLMRGGILHQHLNVSTL
jgi:hypothetical protein